jgi:hypothetical protein
MKNLKFILLIIVLAIGALVGYIWLKPNHETVETSEALNLSDTESNKNSEKENFSSATNDDQKKLDADHIEAEKLANSVNPWHSPANFEEVEKWKESRGYYSAADLDIYKNYSAETIEQLAKGGDIKAIYQLARLKVAEGASKKEDIVNIYLDAAVLGSSYALGRAGTMASSDPSFSRFQGEDGEQLYKKEMLEALSIYQVALIRGDREVLEQVNQARSKLELTPEDDEYIKARGAEIYSELEEKRKSLGLGPFDNSVPQIVKNYHDDAVTGFKRFIDRK